MPGDDGSKDIWTRRDETGRDETRLRRVAVKTLALFPVEQERCRPQGAVDRVALFT